MKNNQSFEQAIEMLDKITKQLEDPATTLENSIAAFEQGVSLIRFCKETLSKAEAKISVLTQDEKEEIDDTF